MDLLPTWPPTLSLFSKSLCKAADVYTASYVIGKEGGDSDSDDNLQWLKHGPHDKDQTLAQVVCVKVISGWGKGTSKGQSNGFCAPIAAETNEEDNEALDMDRLQETRETDS
ncbi:hypothetical protein TREES_T100016740 [Tupaia chinensis]|uniref:Uncharacterized protein n=1 Tax=Tupaia chinensis TaxID=246437 RepID=L9L334_TUPCH|nr:hypothetical protein TREES_T100016740 [Tupaia chinensis]